MSVQTQLLIFLLGYLMLSVILPIAIIKMQRVKVKVERDGQ